jgi:hypothetical protein
VVPELLPELLAIPPPEPLPDPLPEAPLLVGVKLPELLPEWLSEELLGVGLEEPHAIVMRNAPATKPIDATCARDFIEGTSRSLLLRGWSVCPCFPFTSVHFPISPPVPVWLNVQGEVSVRPSSGDVTMTGRRRRER